MATNEEEEGENKSIRAAEAAKLLGLPLEVLLRMRGRNTISQKSGPPYRKTLDEDGNTIYLYDKDEIIEWLKAKNLKIQITAKDAADTLGVEREDLLKTTGMYRHELLDGDLLVYPSRNIFIWVGKKHG